MSIPLDQNESILLEGRGVPQRWGWPLSLLLLFVMVGAAFYSGTFPGTVIAIFAFIFWISFLPSSIINTLAMRARRYVITNSRIVLALGIVAKRVWELPLQYISSVEVPQSFIRKERGIGKILFLSFQARKCGFRPSQGPCANPTDRARGEISTAHIDSLRPDSSGHREGYHYSGSLDTMSELWQPLSSRNAKESKLWS